MKFTVISETGHNLGLAMRLSSEGHALNFISAVPVGKNIVKHNHEDLVGDVYIFDSHAYITDSTALRQKGFRVLGADKWSKTLQENPSYKRDILTSIGLTPSDSTKGINMYVTAWFNGKDYISVYSSLVYRRLMPGGKGPDVNFTGVVSVFGQEKVERIQNQVLKPMAGILRKINHRGCVTIHLIVQDGKISVKDFDADSSSPLSSYLFENTKMSACDILLSLFNEDSKPIKHINEWTAGVLLSIPPYPYNFSDSPEVLVDGIVPQNLKHLWLTGVNKNNDKWYTSTNSKVGYVMAHGVTHWEAIRRVYRTIGEINIPDIQYRNDIGKRIDDMLMTLRKHELITFSYDQYESVYNRNNKQNLVGV